MRIFGGILPFIGWRTIEVDSDGEPTEGGSLKADVLEVAWLDRGAVLYVGKVYR